MDELVMRLRNEAETERYLLPHSDNGTAAILDEAADAIEKLSRENESLEKDVEIASYVMARRWIPVTERLPELNENVLVYSAHSGLIRIDANIWFDRNATHWMPLPQPPKEEKIS